HCQRIRRHGRSPPLEDVAVVIVVRRFDENQAEALVTCHATSGGKFCRVQSRCRFSRTHPEGSTAAARTILMMSPGINGKTVKRNAVKALVRVESENQPQPQNMITREPISIASTAVKNCRSQSCSANAPVT